MRRSWPLTPSDGPRHRGPSGPPDPTSTLESLIRITGAHSRTILQVDNGPADSAAPAEPTCPTQSSVFWRRPISASPFPLAEPPLISSDSATGMLPAGNNSISISIATFPQVATPWDGSNGRACAPHRAGGCRGIEQQWSEARLDVADASYLSGGVGRAAAFARWAAPTRRAE